MRIASYLVLCLALVTLAPSCTVDDVRFFHHGDAGPVIDGDLDAVIDAPPSGPVTLVVSATDMTVPEGGQQMLMVSLSGAPTEATLVTITSANDLRVGVVPTALLFQPSTFAMPQTVMVTGKEDSNTVDEQTDVSVVSTQLSSIISVTVHVDDDDGLNIVATPSNQVEVGEGATATVAVRLGAQPPPGATIVSVASTMTGAATVSPATLTFTEQTWNVDQTVTVTGVEDANTANETSMLDLTATGVTAAAIPIQVIDNDVLGIVPSRTNLGSIAEGSSTTTFDVTLSQMPAANVTVTVMSANTAVVTAAPATLTFTPANYNVGQTVTVTAPQDGDTSNAATTISLTATGLTTRVITVSVTDDDLQAIVAAPNPVSVPEGGGSMFGVRLAFAPTATTTVTVSSLNGTVAAVSPATLTFTPANFATPQTVMVTGAQDLDATDTATTIRLEDANDGLVTNVPLTVVDDEQLVIETSVAAVSLGEAGTTTFMVRLSALPGGNVTVNVTSGNPSSASVAPATLTFTPATYMAFQTVTVSGVQDVNLVNEAISINLAASGLPLKSVTATVTDDDMQAITVSSPTVTVAEGGTGTIGVSLAFQPVANVTVTVMSSDGTIATAAPATLTFTPTDYSAAQNITIGGSQDANTVNGTTTVSLTASGATAATVTVTVTDDDTLAIEPDVLSINVNEGGVQTLGVRLRAQPAASTTVMVASNNLAAATVAPAMLTFTTANWNVFQNVTVAGVEDANTADDLATVILSSTGLSNVNVAITIVDNDTQSIVASTGTVTLGEAGNATFGVHLGAMPAGNVVVNVASGDPTAATVSTTSLTFTPANFATDQQVTVNGVNDVDLANEAVSITLSSPGLANRVVTANVMDDDMQRVVVTQTTVMVNEGQMVVVGVSLTNQPAGPVTVTLGSNNPSVAGVMPPMLTFNAANFSVAQNVNVIGIQDPDPANGTAEINASAPGAGTAIIDVTVIDDDVLGIDVDQTDMVVEENNARVFGVRLTAQPATNRTVTIKSQNAAIADVSPMTLTFTTTNWNSYQGVQVFGSDDGNTEHDRVGIDVTSPGLAPRDVKVTVPDDDLLAADVKRIDTCAGQTFDMRVFLFGPPFTGAPVNGTLTVKIAAKNSVVSPIEPDLVTFDTGTFGDAQQIKMSTAFSPMDRFDQLEISAPGQKSMIIDVAVKKRLSGDPLCAAF